MKLRNYQQELVDKIKKSLLRGKTRVCAVLGCGGGKSVIQGTIAASATAKKNRVLFIVHRKELCQQITKTFENCNVDFDYCHVGMVQTVCRRLQREPEPTLILIDECFPAGTMVDGKPIETFKIGDTVNCFDEAGNVYKSKVTRVFKNPAPKELIKIAAKDRIIICTKNHPVFTAEGWKKAEEIRKGDLIYGLALHRVRNEKEIQEREFVPDLLQTQNVTEEQGNIIRAHEASQSYGEFSYKGKNGSHTAKNRTQAKNPGWKWQRINCSAENVKRSTRMDDRVRSAHPKEKGDRLSNLLQDRHSKSTEENRHRGRRCQSLCHRTTKTRQEKRRTLDLFRVENIEVYKSRNTEQFERVCPDGFVYNLEVEKYHTYFANGIAVHNCHHSLSQSYLNILNYFPNALVLGFTATPQRMNEGGLGKVFQELIESVSTEWLIKNHHLAPYEYYSVQLADASKLHTRNGDYDKQEVEKLMNKGAIFGSAVENWLKYAKGKQTIIYCSSIATSKATAAAFCKQGIKAMHLDGKTPQDERQAIVEEFRNGEVTVLCNVDLFGEGFDVPDCECVVLLRPTKSLTLHVQQSMRSMRVSPTNPDKVALILDHVGNNQRHGVPDDIRTWTLESKKKKKASKITTKQCPVCFRVLKMTEKICPSCKYEFVPEPQEEREIVEGIILERVSKLPYKQHENCQTFAQLELFRKTHKRGDGKTYRFSWSLYKAAELNIPVPSQYRAFAFRAINKDTYRRLRFY